MPRTRNALTSMEEHSIAKVELYSTYFSTYISIMNNSGFINTIYLYDLFAGEGIDINGQQGSPIVAIENIINLYHNRNSCPNMKIWFNDKDRSDIEPSKWKIERVEEKISSFDVPDNVIIEYSHRDFSDLIPVVEDKLNRLKTNERALLFIDPNGYREIRPTNLYNLLQNGRTEIILFLPIQFMWRFLNTSQNSDFPGGEPLRHFTTELFGNDVLEFENSLLFIEALKVKFKDYLPIEYSDTFTIERDRNQFFCLFYFTNNKLGFIKMLEAKWKLDDDNGRGFSFDRNMGNLFGDRVAREYESQLRDFIMENEPTNLQIFDFGLELGFLPKHSNDVIKKNIAHIRKESLDSGSTKGNYINNETRSIKFIWGD